MKQFYLNTKRLNTYVKYNDTYVQTVKFKEYSEIITKDFDEPQLNINLIKKIKTIGDTQNRQTNLQGDMTDWKMQHEEEFSIIGNFALTTINKVFNKNNLILQECWGGVYRKGDICHPHNHIPHAWSFVYYADANTDDSPLLFPTADLAIYPYTGLLVAFPSWVTHSVPPQENDKERIIVAGNLKQLL